MCGELPTSASQDLLTLFRTKAIESGVRHGELETAFEIENSNDHSIINAPNLCST